MSFPPSEIPLGAIRFNSDSQKLEYWIGDAWMQIKTFSPTLDGGARGLAIGGNTQPGGVTNKIDFITIASAGNASDFGDLQQERIQASATASQTRGVQ